MPSEDAAKINVQIISNEVILEIDNERKRQVNRKGYSSAHDDMHEGGELRYAAAAYCLGEMKVGGLWLWPWEGESAIFSKKLLLDCSVGIGSYVIAQRIYALMSS